MTFGEKLRVERDAAGLTQQALAAQSGIPLGTVRHYEQGYRLPSYAAVVAISLALKCRLDAFADCSDVQAEAKPKRRKK